MSCARCSYVITKSAYLPHDATILPVYNPLPGSWFAAAYIPNWNEQMQQEMVRCQAEGCPASLGKPYVHVVCRSHANCAVQLESYMFWPPDACTMCYEMVSSLVDEHADPAVRHEARTNLRKWVAGFGKNALEGQPYVLDAGLCALLFQGATATTAVPAKVAEPLIEAIRLATMPATDDQDLMDNVAAININIEPILTEEQVGGEVSDASLLLSPTPSSSSSFLGFSKPTTLAAGALSVAPKVKTFKTKTLKKGTKPAPPAATVWSSAPQPSTSTQSPAALNPSPDAGIGLQSTVPRAAESGDDLEAFTNLLLSRVSGVIDQRLEAMRLASVPEASGQAFTSLTERIKPLEDMLSGLLHSGTSALSMMVPDASKLPPFDKENPWRLALHAPFLEGKLTIEGCGTRPIEDFEMFPPGLQFPFPGYVRLAQHALVRVDKIPKETVIFPREQSQNIWVHIKAPSLCL
ncbi:uncharacterized protein LOC135202485 isoform X1 [Macrobrachium nipponense]|uniref:uncharacterized protein LOC135202485 isoform X1 n=1 Tax=Macrobrachium nipponense TaxID=159736 RepID=UPI0030C81AC4